MWTADWSTWPKWSIKCRWLEKEAEHWYLEVDRSSALTSQGPATVNELEEVRQSLIAMCFLWQQSFLVYIFIFEQGKDLWLASFQCFHEVSPCRNTFLGKQHHCGSDVISQILENGIRFNSDVINIWLFQNWACHEQWCIDLCDKPLPCMFPLRPGR